MSSSDYKSPKETPLVHPTEIPTPKGWQVSDIHSQHLPFTFYPRLIKYHVPSLNIDVEMSSRAIRKNRWPATSLKHQHVEFEWIDFKSISWQVAFWFTLGSCLWIVNGQYALFPTNDSNFDNLIMGYSALAGGLLFEIGALFAYWESLNEPIEADFGEWIQDLSKEICRKPVYKPVPWRYYGTNWKSMGFVANFTQLIGATIFTFAVICGIPAISTIQNTWQLQQALWWTPQTLGSICFFVSSMISMLEEQKEWWLPNLKSIGWWSAFWNAIGSLGFLFCAIFGYLANWQGQGAVCCQVYGTALSTYWGSWAFLISSVLLLVEVVLKHPAPSSDTRA